MKLDRFCEMLDGSKSGLEVLSTNQISFDSSITIPARSPMIIEIE
ncbi:MAG: cyclomaltodextrinase C-terminal domain-containing protein [Cyclobacteriaceae bacterium]|nr:cyclomaltodextrinase C-terminal domain-containing protein [Cyclobacteriaceae bacterium HetDA_MAG_MS6]